MPHGRFDNASLTAISPSLPSAPLEMSSYAAPFTHGPALESGTMSPETEWPEQKVDDLRSLGRGVGWALTIEGAAGLGFYAVWHLWHFFR